MSEIVQTDVLVIGGGGAGARAAVEASEYRVGVAIANKGVIAETGCTAVSTRMCTNRQGFGVRADPETYAVDIIRNGLGMNDPRLARILTYEARERVEDLTRFGLEFEPDTFIIKGKGAGKPIVTVLKEEMMRQGVDIRENVMVIDLLTNRGNVVGAIGLNMKTLDTVIFEAKSTVLATGGTGGLYIHNVNTPCITGDGYAMAYRAGAELVNMEFIRMGEVTLSPVKGLLFRYDLWRLKPKIYNAAQEEFVKKYIPPEVDLDTAFELRSTRYYFTTANESRYINIALYKEIAEGRGTENGGVYVDFTDIPEEVIREKASQGYEFMLSRGVDICQTPVEIAPATHHFYGGLRIDDKTQTTLPGLFAAGEVVGNVHGADRIGGTALVETQVFGARAGKYAAIRALSKTTLGIDQRQVQEIYGRVLFRGSGEIRPRALKERVQRIAWHGAHIVRNGEGLRQAILEFEEARKALQEADVNEEGIIDAHVTKNLIEVGEMVARAALLRRETRAVHYRKDYPQLDNENWLKVITFKRVAGQMTWKARPPTEAYF
ncbi:MAG: FAD-binding protein [Candidatus Bathyarchaeia archaeon]